MVCGEMAGVSHADSHGKNSSVGYANRGNLMKLTLFSSGSDLILRVSDEDQS